jgi:hypothetical protein
MPRWRTLGAVSLALALAGCVRLPPPSKPAQTAACRVGTAWSTAYARVRRLGDLDAEHVRVLRYQVTAKPKRGRPCGSLTLDKTLIVRRGPGPLRIVEIRDFYAHGRLVADHRAFIGHELTASGVYKARVTLPIPAQTPPGRYQIVSLLYARWGQGAPLLIARAQTRFTVVR